MSDSAFIRSMLEQIDEFQYRRHLAWNERAPFGERIERLPLYFLEFNNHDRDKSRHGPTIAHYSPARRELRALARFCQSLVPHPTVLDVGCGNGFIGSLLAREGVRVIGIDDYSWPPPQIGRFSDADRYELHAPCSLADYTAGYDIALCSWMVPGGNLTEAILANYPSAVIHIFSTDRYRDGKLITGTEAAYRCPEDYKVAGGWDVSMPADYFAAIVPELMRMHNLPKKRSVEVWVRKDLSGVPLEMPQPLMDEYAWQKERDVLNQIRQRMGLATYKVPVAHALN